MGRACRALLSRRSLFCVIHSQDGTVYDKIFPDLILLKQKEPPDVFIYCHCNRQLMLRIQFFLYVLCLAGETLSHSKDDAADRSSNDYHFVHLTIAEVSAGAFWNQYALDCACDQSCAQSVVSDSSGRKRYQKTAFYTLFSYMLWFIFSLGFAGFLDFCTSRWNPSVYFFIPSEHPVQLFAGLGDEQGDSQIRSLQDHSLSAEPN